MWCCGRGRGRCRGGRRGRRPRRLLAVRGRRRWDRHPRLPGGRHPRCHGSEPPRCRARAMRTRPGRAPGGGTAPLVCLRAPLPGGRGACGEPPPDAPRGSRTAHGARPLAVGRAPEAPNRSSSSRRAPPVDRCRRVRARRMPRRNWRSRRTHPRGRARWPPGSCNCGSRPGIRCAWMQGSQRVDDIGWREAQPTT